MDQQQMETPTQCLKCRTKLEATTAVKSGPPGPTPGALSICWYCGALAVFDEDLQLRELTADERATLAEPDLAEFLQRLEAHRRRRMARRN